MATNIPGPPPAGPAPAGVPPKKGGALKFILIGCGGLVVVVVLIVAAAITFGVYKAKQAGLDPDLMKRDPAFATAKMLATMAPGAEIVSADEGSGIIKIKDKKTGKVLTIDVAQTSRKRQIVVKDENGEELTFQAHEGAGGQGSFEMKSKEGTATFGTGAAAKWPAWVPGYPGVTAQGNFSMQAAGGDSGSFGFTTKDPVAQVSSFYEQGFKSAGLTVTTHTMPAGSMVMGEDTANKRSAMVNATSDNSGTHVTVTYETKKQ